MVSFVPRDGVPVRDPRLQAIQGGPFVYLRDSIALPESDPAAQQLLRHVRRGELLPGDAHTAALAGVPYSAPQSKLVRKGLDQ